MSDRPMRASLQVAPLEFSKPPIEVLGDGLPHQDQDHKSSYKLQASKLYVQSQMTPPATPNGSQEDLSPELEPIAAPVFHNFLRAFYPFHPTYAMNDSSVTLPLDEGDIVLVHSIHTNGWADGTLLESGARGWLPTNYCEEYSPEEMRNLLMALLGFWDILRSTSVDDSEIFQNQEFIRGLIGGVRNLLECTQCLNRESTLIQRSDTLRKCRKLLLSELSSLVKTAKRLQEIHSATIEFPEEHVNDVVDQMILKAFKIVTRGVRFLDVVDDDRRARLPSAVTVMSTVIEEPDVPPTPPADHSAFIIQTAQILQTFDNGVPQSLNSNALVGLAGQHEAQQSQQGPWTKRMSSLNPEARRKSRGFSQNRLSANMSHRVSMAGPSPLSQPHYLISERLNRSHDMFLSNLASFIGRLHPQSQSRAELARSIKHSASSGGELLAVIDVVCHYGISTSIVSIPAALNLARESLLERIHSLVFSARDILVSEGVEGTDIILQDDKSILLMSAADCVKAAGDCDSKAKTVLERIGDFEFEPELNALHLNLNILDVEEERSRTPSIAERSDCASTVEPSPVFESPAENPRRPSVAAIDKPLPQVPDEEPAVEEFTHQAYSSVVSQPSSAVSLCEPTLPASLTSNRPSLPPLPKLTTTLPAMENENAHQPPILEHDFHIPFESMTGSSTGSSATYLSRDSENSLVSQNSTRATTPDQILIPRSQPSISELSATGSSTHTEEGEDVESRLLVKTFAHELVFNKEGQVTGGSLPALIERLTMHEATPDATFVSTFYLTFRLFCSPIKLTESLIDRFEYVGESPYMSTPVRLRVYNAFKGWLESHWRDQTDREALKLIIPFARNRLNDVLPSASSRLLELAHRVSGEGALVPRLLSSMGKTNTAVGQYVPADLPLPSPIISKGQLNTLHAFRIGSASPTVLDFDPLEVARQLTVRQMGIFCSILPEELLSSQWMKKGGIDAPNVKAMSSLSTDLSNLVADSILQQAEIKKRAAVVKHWIKIAQQCLELHNYDSLMAIICSLNSSTISRLRKTWDLLSLKRKETLSHLQEIVEPSQNNKVLRTRLHDHVPPCLPFLGMYLTDLTFVDIGNPATKQISLGGDSDEENGSGLAIVNFDKHTRTSKIIGELQRFQIPYRLIELPEMQDWISAEIQRTREGDQGNVQVTYYRKSLLLEPRETALRREVEPQTPTLMLNATTRGDLFGWMTRDRGLPTSGPPQS